MANIELPEDAEGHEIPLDTMTLYDEDGNEYEVHYYTYSVRQTIPQRKWQVVMMDCIAHDVSNLYPTPPDSREKLEEDLSRASEHRFTTSYCRYFNTTDRCVNCPIHNDDAPMSRTIAHDATMLSMIRNAVFGLDGSIFQRLTDPIDRPDNPTCRNLSNDYRSFHCSRCGYKAFTYSDSDCNPDDFPYCPECRAEVVGDGH